MDSDAGVDEPDLSDFYTWKYSTRILWFLVLFLNATFTAIGIGLRDLSGTDCFLNVTRTFGDVNKENGEGFFFGTVFIYPICCAVIITVQAVYMCTRFGKGDICHNLLVNVFVAISGTLYIAADNFFFLVDPAGLLPSMVNAATARSFIAATSILSTLVVVVINQLVVNPTKRTGHFCTCDGDCCQGKHGLDERCSDVCCRGEKSCNAEDCCKPESNCMHGKDHAKCKIGSNSCKFSIHRIERSCECEGHCCSYHKQKLSWTKFILLWSPWASVVATFDALFISVITEVSGEQEVKSGVDCTERYKPFSAMGYHVASSGLLSVGIILFGIIQVYRLFNKWDLTFAREQKCSNMKQDNIRAWVDHHHKYLGTTYIIVISFVFFLIGAIFMAVDNNWPWICFAKEQNNICTWVRVRVGLLALIAFSAFVLFIGVSLLSISELYNSNQTDNHSNRLSSGARNLKCCYGCTCNGVSRSARMSLEDTDHEMVAVT
jgi:hypothetical protein